MSRKRRKHPDALKARIALEAVKGVQTMSELSSEFKVHPTVITRWKQQLIKGASSIFSGGNGLKEKGEEELTGPLYAEIGRLKMELDWLKKKL